MVGLLCLATTLVVHTMVVETETWTDLQTSFTPVLAKS